MPTKVWQTIQVIHCERLGHEVALEAEIIYPPEHLPGQAPQVVAHRCSFGLECNLVDKPACLWAGTNPNYDPFAPL